MKTYDIQAGMDHFERRDHDSTNCAPCELRADHLKWLKDHETNKKAKR